MEVEPVCLYVHAMCVSQLSAHALDLLHVCSSLSIGNEQPVNEGAFALSIPPARK